MHHDKKANFQAMVWDDNNIAENRKIIQKNVTNF
jgi:hypothetical protein